MVGGGNPIYLKFWAKLTLLEGSIFQKWSAGDVPTTSKFGGNWQTPFKNARIW